MKLAIVVPGGVDRGGTDRVVPVFLWLIERLARHHDVHVFASRQEPEPGDWELLGAHVHNIGMMRGATRRLIERVGAEHARAKFDLVHAFFGWSGAAAALIGWRFHVPMIFHAAGGEFVGLRDIEYGMRTTMRDSLASWMAVRGARRVTVATTYMQRLAMARGAEADVVPLGVAVDCWPAAAVRARIAAAPLQLLNIGDVRPVKDQSMLIDVARRLEAAGLKFDLHLAGLGTDSQRLHRISDIANVRSVLHGYGVLRRDELRTLVERVDLLLVTSRHEAGPVAVLEAAVAGIPTVGTSVGHVADWAPAAAVSVPAGDAAAMATEVLALSSDESRRRALAMEAQRRALEIDADFTAREFERIYAEVLGDRSGKPT